LPDTCDALSIEIDSGGPADGSYLTITELTSQCALLTDDTPFAAGGTGGLQELEVEIEYGIDRVQYLSGETVVEISSTLDDARLDAVVATLAPIDRDTLAHMAAAAEPSPDEP
jgi:hypothetical protein